MFGSTDRKIPYNRKWCKKRQNRGKTWLFPSYQLNGEKFSFPKRKFFLLFIPALLFFSILFRWFTTEVMVAWGRLRDTKKNLVKEKPLTYLRGAEEKNAGLPQIFSFKLEKEDDTLGDFLFIWKGFFFYLRCCLSFRKELAKCCNKLESFKGSREYFNYVRGGNPRNLVFQRIFFFILLYAPNSFTVTFQK